MAKQLVKYKSKKFKTKGEANAWAKKEKEAYGPVGVLRIEVNRITDGNDVYQWEVILMRTL